MHRHRQHATSTALSLTALAAAAALLAACGSSSSAPAPSVTLAGVVASSGFTPGSATNPTLSAGYYQGALVCIDANGNGKCDTGETQATTGSKGEFSITTGSSAALIADIGTGATNSATG
ncbi:MAG: phosphoesterase, partial [Massilia sp.]|nr:phosphoesterase [Massilia sp.]